jgi:hypothetical protein
MVNVIFSEVRSATMTSPRTTDRRRLWAGLLRLALAAGAVPLLVAPTCGGGGEGLKTFSQHSLIIPMDVCYQSQADGASRTHKYTPTSCPGTQDPGSVIKAYGLAYQLIRSNIAVYWIIDQGKQTLTDYDLSVQYNGGFPVNKYNWSTRAPGAPPATPADHIIRYRGGPFVVDGSDYDRALQVLRAYENTFGPNSGAPVNVHISNVAFQGWAKKTMAGGWSAGGTVPPKLALLDIGSGNASAVDANGRPTAMSNGSAKNAQPVISGYLVEAGIGAGTAAGTATGTHGEIYDTLSIADFQPATGSTDPHTSNFFKNGYEILWVPHWVAPGSCSNFSAGGGKTAEQNCVASLYSQASIDQTLKTIGVYVSEGHDLFAECAGLGSFEGAFKYKVTTTTPSSYTVDYQDGDLSTRFQSTLGERYNELANNPFGAPSFNSGSFGSPLLQLGDYGFTPKTGAVEDYRPQDGSSYQPDVTRLITGSGTDANWDYFSVRPRVTGSNRGTIVYLAGHSYSGVQGDFEVSGSRLVLNTLFNLGAACTASGVACDTGKLGVCGKGVIQCVNGQPACVQTVFPSPEVCDGLDNDCNGLVDDMDTSCYDGPAGTLNVGLCHAGVSSCQLQPDGKTYAMSACVGEVVPTAEVCNGLDDNCNGQVDENLTQECYTGPSTSLGPDGRPQGTCKAGTQTCTNGAWGACTGQVLPRAEDCSTPLDENCDGQVNEYSSCGNCTPGQTLVGCYTGPAGTVNVGVCKAGTQTCGADGHWGPCVGQVTPTPEVCSPASCATNPSDPACNKDENCNGQVDEGCGCNVGDKQTCYDGPAATQNVGTCKAGYKVCDAGVFTGACLTEIMPTPEVCDGQDNDCNGLVDDGATCNAGFYCTHGVCVPDSCGVEQDCPEGYKCDGTTAKCVRDTCGDAKVTCPDGQACSFGQCVSQCPGPNQPSICFPGAYCQSGGCVGGSCYVTGCPAGQVCQQGACKADACAGVACPSGTFCRQGDCVQSCVFATCGPGQKCSVDGFCETDACAGKSCGPTQKCDNGRCVEDTCLGQGKSCGVGQVCQDQICVDDPCNGVVCPVGKCLAGQCYAIPTPANHGGDQPVGGSGGGCGSGTPSPLSALLLLAIVPLARRRRRARAVAPIAVALVALGLAASACKGGGSAQFDPSSCTDANYPACPGENHCVSIWTDTANCGGCGAACDAGQICVDKACGPSSAVAPRISGISPGSGAQGASDPVTVTITGSRFASGATLRTSSAQGTATVATEYVDSTHLRAAIDLSASGPETLYARIVNPDRVISNAVPFDVITPTPSISSLSPNSVKTGAPATITVHGTGFLPTSFCRLSGPGFAVDLALSTTTSGADLLCAVDATGLTPSTAYAIRVVTPADPTPLVSGPAALAVTTQQPMLTDVSPNVGEAGSPIAMTLGGSGFDSTSVMLWDGNAANPVPTLMLDSGHLYIAQYTLPGTAGTHTVSVRNGTSGAGYLTSATQSFTVGSSPATISTVSPSSAYQGDTGITLRVSGTGFTSPALIQLQPPGGAWGAALATTVTTTQVSTSTPQSFVNQPAGDWLVRLCYASPCTASSPTSATLPFRVLSNQAILQAASPRSAAQGTSTVVAMTVANLRPLASGSPSFGVTVKFSGASAALTPSLVSGTTVQATVNTTGLQTGTYTLQVTNPNGAADSNSLAFNVTPGVPTVSSVSPTSAPMQDAEVLVTITGTNFSRPDLSGNGGSTVHASSTTLGITDWAIASFRDCTVAHPLPWACVTSATQVQVHLDTRAGVPGAYDLAVWNPGGPTPPQKSNTLTGAFTITG